jgi:hypothetical protein
MHAGTLAERNCELGGQVLMFWSFIDDFSSLLGVHPVPMQDLLVAFRAGSLSRFLVNFHIGLIRFIQAEAEAAHLATSHVRTCDSMLCCSMCWDVCLCHFLVCSCCLDWKRIAPVCRRLDTSRGCILLASKSFLDSSSYDHLMITKCCLEAVPQDPTRQSLTTSCIWWLRSVRALP